MNTKYISKCGDYKLEIIQDDDAESPNEWDNEDVFLVYNHREFTVKKDGFEPQHIHQHLKAKEGVDYYNEILKNKDSLNSQQLEDLGYYKHDYVPEYEKYYIFPVEAHIHSGVSLSLTDNFEKQGFDTSVAGFVLVSKVEAISSLEYQKGEPEDLAEEWAEALIETWNTYLMGDVYGFRLYKADKRYSISADNFQNLINSGHGFDEHTRDEYFNTEIEWEEIDSCYGFYGNNIKTNGILEHIDDNIEFEL